LEEFDKVRCGNGVALAMQPGGNRLQQTHPIVTKPGGGIDPAEHGFRRAVPFQFVKQTGFAHAAGAGYAGYQPDFRMVFGPVIMQPVEANFVLSAGKQGLTRLGLRQWFSLRKCHLHISFKDNV